MTDKIISPADAQRRFTIWIPRSTKFTTLVVLDDLWTPSDVHQTPPTNVFKEGGGQRSRPKQLDFERYVIATPFQRLMPYGVLWIVVNNNEALFPV